MVKEKRPNFVFNSPTTALGSTKYHRMKLEITPAGHTRLEFWDTFDSYVVAIVQESVAGFQPNKLDPYPDPSGRYKVILNAPPETVVKALREKGLIQNKDISAAAEALHIDLSALLGGAPQAERQELPRAR